MLCVICLYLTEKETDYRRIETEKSIAENDYQPFTTTTLASRESIDMEFLRTISEKSFQKNAPSKSLLPFKLYDMYQNIDRRCRVVGA